jgi:hypothetical protein
MPAAVSSRWCRRRFLTWLASRLTWQHAWSEPRRCRSRRRTTRQLCSREEKILLYLHSNPWPLRRFTFHELGSLTVSSRRRWRFERLFYRLRLRHWISVWGPAGRVTAAVYKTRPIRPRRGATGDAGGAAGGKVRNINTNQQPRMPRE